MMNERDKLQQALTQVLDMYQPQRVILAVSGGLDSTLLAQVFHDLKWPGTVCMVYINHGLSPNTLYWQQQVAALATTLEFEFLAIPVTVPETVGRGVEAAARQARYAALAQCLQAGDCCFTAHHADDQAETVLLQVCRGAGPQGLRAMPTARPLGQGVLVRPWLGFARAQLLRVAEYMQLAHVDDESNHDTRYSRNYLRHDIIPALQQHWPGLLRSCAQVAAANQLACAASDFLLQPHLEQCVSEQKLLLSPLLALPQSVQYLIVRAWLSAQSLATPPTRQVMTWLTQLRDAPIDKQPKLQITADSSLQRFQGAVYVVPDWPNDMLQQWRAPWNGLGRLDLPAGLGYLMRVDSCAESLPWDRVTVGFRQGGEQFKPEGSSHTLALKKWFQARAVPPWLRAVTPLLFQGDELVGVIGMAFATAFRQRYACQVTAVKLVAYPPI